MRLEQAQAIVNTIISAWEWEMDPQTIELWQKFLVDLQDAEAAELAVIDLYRNWTRQRGKHPMFGDVTEHYRAMLRRLADEKRPAVAALPEPELPPNAPAELREFTAQLRARNVRGGGLVRAVLVARGVSFPIDAKHADSWDPPLTLCEQRHRIHVFQDVQLPGCRLCLAARTEPVGA